MTLDHSGRSLRTLLRVLSEHPLNGDNAFRAQLAAVGCPVPLRPHETLALALPSRVASTIQRVEFYADGGFRLFCDGAVYFYAHPRRPPTVEEIPMGSSPTAESILRERARCACGPVAIVRTKDGEQIEGTDHPAFAEIQRDTVRMVGGKLRYVGWAQSEYIRDNEPPYIDWRFRNGPSLVVDGVVSPIACDDYTNVLTDGDDLYVLTLEMTQVSEPEPAGPFSDGHDGKRRETRVRTLDGTVDVLVADSTPHEWNFIAMVGGTLILTGGRRDGKELSPKVAVHFPERHGLLGLGHGLIGKGRRLQNGALVECTLKDGDPGFAWFADDDATMFAHATFPLYGPLKNIEQTAPHTLEGWHTEGDTIFLTRYERAVSPLR